MQASRCLKNIDFHVLYNEDCLDTARRLASDSVNLIYVDPPFYTDRIFQRGKYRFDDTWDDVDEYISWLKPKLEEFKRILQKTGSIYIHSDWHISHNIKVLADRIFGRTNFLNEIVWQRQSSHNDASQGSRHFGRIHDSIFIYTMSSDYTWNQQYTPYSESHLKSAYRHVEPESNRRYALGDLTGPGGASKGNPKYEFLGNERYWRYSKQKMKNLLAAGKISHKEGRLPYLKRYLDEMKGKPIQDIWTDIPPEKGKKYRYPTQKPVKLLSRIIKTSSNPGDLIYDPFMGSGTSGVVCSKLSRNWIGSDTSCEACKLAFERLKALGCKVFFEFWANLHICEPV